jgi:hypothetical protein
MDKIIDKNILLQSIKIKEIYNTNLEIIYLSLFPIIATFPTGKLANYSFDILNQPMLILIVFSSF